MLCGQHQSIARVLGGQSSAPVFGCQNYFPSPSTYSAGNSDSGNSAYLSDSDYQVMIITHNKVIVKVMGATHNKVLLHTCDIIIYMCIT